jgi:sucrose-6-phosphatase
MAIRFFSSDLDGTLLGKPDATIVFKCTWEKIPADSRPLLCYNTGRVPKDALALIPKSNLPKPDYLICGLGTSIYDYGAKAFVEGFEHTLLPEWDRKKINKIAQETYHLDQAPESVQNPFKSTWQLHDASREQIDRFRKELKEAGLNVTVIYSNASDITILPRSASKGKALSWLLRHLKIKPSEALVAGDGGNDSSMFRIKGINGIIVENAQPELYEATVETSVYFAQGFNADGVLDGMRHFGIIEKPEIVDCQVITERNFEPEIIQLFDPCQIRELDTEQRDFVGLAYQKAVAAIRKNITPLGFSACSITDNEARGTDVNYHSVWGRDGAITVIGTLSLKDPDIRTCQRNTLDTLLRHISLSGQIPANVRVSDEVPDYSGIGGICSVDSGIWVIIAAYEYIRVTKDHEFLDTHIESLQRAMNWLSAHDGNNDALLEIPEAGDWTDLFGRSYNVLYDEVLWYQANISFGLLLEWQGEPDRAGDYLRWAQTIKAAILRKFWPSTNGAEVASKTFADRQFSLGDTSYLLAEVTPFGFNWRCDVYGNILAFLYNVLDLDRAKIAFRFMWGVGVNHPWPVANLYPVVTGGDPDWKNYYTVNLLNLPDHYHNGGIWPFIGAQWVRFINRLGLRDLAYQELLRLAELNKQGIAHEWEFNEWAHGKTGIPMGKAFQAWSAAEFIHACHDLQVDRKEFLE